MAFPNPPYPFTNLPAGNNPISYLDTMFADLGNASNVACTASGTNVITLTPNSGFWLPTSYVNYTTFTFVAVATSSGAVTALVSGLSTIKVFMPSGTQASSGDIVNGTFYRMSYNSALDTGSGGFQIENVTVPSVAQTIQGAHKRLAVTNNAGTPNTKIDISADQIVVQNSGGGTTKLSSVALTCDLTTNGANGLDTGAITSGTFYYFYVIYNSTSSTTACLASVSSTSPTLPTGYTYSALISAITTALGSAQLMGVQQRDNVVQYKVGLAQTTTPPNVGAGVTGTFSTTTPTLAALTVSNWVPSATSLATRIHIQAQANWKNATASNIIIAPNTSWGGTNNGPLGSNGMPYPIYLSASATNPVQTAWLTIESSVLGWATDAAGAAANILGYQLNL